MSTPSLTVLTRWRSPDSDCPSRASVATPQWTRACASRTRLDIGPLPLAHRDAGALSEGGHDFEFVHQAAGARQPEPEPARGRVAVLHGARDVANAGSVVLGDDDEPLAGPVDHLGEAHLTALGIHQDVARDLGDGCGDDGLVAGGEADFGGELAAGLARLHNVGVRGDETAE